MKKHPVKLFLIFVICFLAQSAVAQSLSFSRPTVITAVCNEEPFWHESIYEDDDYLFVYRYFGKAEETPVFFILGKKRNKWVELKKLSTEHAKLGRSPSSNSESWDYSSLKTVNYVNLPLRTSGSINFPDLTTYDADNKAYCFNFNSLANVEEMLTQFWVAKKDLDQLLK
jgi:hypothetical protein